VESLQQPELIDQVRQLLDTVNLQALTDEQRSHVVRGVWYDHLKEELREQVRHARVDLEERVQEWLDTLASPHTRRAYQRALHHFLAYLDRKEIHPLEVKAREVDAYLAFLRTEPLSPNSQRLYVAACSAFYGTLERFDDVARNYFRGARLPTRQRCIKTHNEIPDAAAVTAIMTALQQEQTLSAGRGARQKVRQARYLLPVVHLITHYGFRVGALPQLTIDVHGHYTTLSKGTQIAGQISAETLSLLEASGLSRKHPFQGYKVNSMQRAFARFGERVRQQGLIPTVYSLHDLRHYFAVQVYQQDRDLLALRDRLGHASVAVTEIYLSSLQVSGLHTPPSRP
jgi:site-specific recombinase XerD